jgi:hypothetical protein
MINLRLDETDMELLVDSLRRNKERLAALQQRYPEFSKVCDEKRETLALLLHKLHKQNEDDGLTE